MKKFELNDPAILIIPSNLKRNTECSGVGDIYFRTLFSSRPSIKTDPIKIETVPQNHSIPGFLPEPSSSIPSGAFQNTPGQHFKRKIPGDFQMDFPTHGLLAVFQMDNAQK